MSSRKLWATRSDIEQLYSDDGVHFIADFGDGIELWETGWKVGIIFSREDGVHPKANLYELDFIKRRLDILISNSKPPGWKKA